MKQREKSRCGVAVPVLPDLLVAVTKPSSEENVSAQPPLPSEGISGAQEGLPELRVCSGGVQNHSWRFPGREGCSQPLREGRDETIGAGIVAPPCWEPGIAFLGSRKVLTAPSGMLAVLLHRGFPLLLTAQGPAGGQRWKAQSSPVALRANTLHAPILSSMQCNADIQHFLNPTLISESERSCF